MIERLNDFLWCESVANPDSFSCVYNPRVIFACTTKDGGRSNHLIGLASCHPDGCRNNSLGSEVIRRSLQGAPTTTCRKYGSR